MTETNEDGLLSPSDMSLWLQVEMRSVRMAARRRMREAKAIVDDYAAAKITPEEANSRLDAHEKQWGRGANDSAVGSAIHENAAQEIYERRRAMVDRPTEGRTR